MDVGGARAAASRRWNGWAWAAVGAAAAFVAISVWWVAADRGVPVGDTASDLLTIAINRDLLAAGDLGGLFHHTGIYPPLTFLVGVLATFVGGLGVTAPVLAENVVYVPLLALGCYQVGRRLAGPQAGFLAVAFALGSPLIIEQFHVFMLDAPEAAIVALAVWLILASERFARVGSSALAGLAVGVGFESKEHFPLFVVGLLAVVLLRERGWRNWRGIAAFAAVAFVAGAPWYLARVTHLGEVASGGLTPPDLPMRSRPDIVSFANLGWYMWAVLNAVLFAPLFAFAAFGVGRELAGAARRRTADSRWRPADDVVPELLGGLLVAWLVLSLLPHHDIRYAQPLIVYLAVLGTGWIVSLSRGPRALATAALLLAVLATTLGASFGVGREVRVALASDPFEPSTIYGIPPLDEVRIYADHDFNVSAPRRDDDVLALMRTLRREGVTGVTWRLRDFETQGMLFFAHVAGISAPTPGATAFYTHGRSGPLPTRSHRAPWLHHWRWNIADPHHAMLTRSVEPPPCETTSPQYDISITLGNPYDGSGRLYCPKTGSEAVRGPAGSDRAPTA